MRPKARSSKLEQIFELLGKAARGKKCDAIEGILDEGKEIIEEYADTPALDAGPLRPRPSNTKRFFVTAH